MTFRSKIVCSLWILILVALLLPVPAASAHGSTQVGDYTIEVGFKNEPAYQDAPNSLDLIVTRTANHQPVTGLENSLQAEVIFGASRKTLKIEPVDGVAGEYTAAIIPTELGDYTWHITGAIEKTPLDISMTSSPTTFASVVPASTDAFPNRGGLSLAGLQSQLQSARTLTLLALIAGVAGLLLGLVSLGISLKRR